MWRIQGKDKVNGRLGYRRPGGGGQSLGIVNVSTSHNDGSKSKNYMNEELRIKIAISFVTNVLMTSQP